MCPPSSTRRFNRRSKWIRDSLPLLNPKSKDFIVDARNYNGINCRFGMRGVIAAAHYDGKRNMIAMIRGSLVTFINLFIYFLFFFIFLLGRKRYIILPPEECSNLYLLPRNHPSSRHSYLTWSNLSVVESHATLRDAKATEVSLMMGEVLYLPSYYFHYIISQDASIQCNSRSGNSEKGRDKIKECGFY